MTSPLLEQFSSALAERACAAQASIAAVRLQDGRHLSATLWEPDVAVASEQSLPRREAFELVAAGGATLKAKLAGRDSGTNIAVLRLSRALDAPAWTGGEAMRQTYDSAARITEDMTRSAANLASRAGGAAQEAASAHDRNKARRG